MNIKVAIVEDNAGVRESWAKLINAEPGLRCAGVCESGEEALKRLPALRPDVVLMDIHLPGMSGIKCTALLKAKLPGTHILIVTVYADNEHVFEALKVGASGYLLKCVEPEQLTRSVAEVMRGGAPMTSQIARRVIEVFRRPNERAADAEARLTTREEETLELLARGYANKEIAARLGASIETVRVHIRHIYDKLQVHSRSEATAKYLTGAARETTPLPQR